MTKLIPNSTKITLTDQITNHPFSTLFASHSAIELSLKEKADYLSEFCSALHRLERNTEERFIIDHWGSIAAGLCATFTISGSIALIPVVGWIISGVSTASAVAAIVSAFQSKSQVKPIIESLKLHRLVLESSKPLLWAALWETAEISLFCRSLEHVCSRSGIFHGELERASDNTPLMEAINYVAAALGLSYDEVLDTVIEIAAGRGVGQNTRLVAVDVPALPESQPEKTDSSRVHEAAAVPPNSAVPVDQAGIEILDALALSRRSTLLIGDTGAGKSVTQAYLLTKLFESYPDASVFVLAQKADSFCGLAEKGRVVLFDPTEPTEALILINNIWTIYDKRRRLPESDRPALLPVRLILADWLSINQSLEELKNDESVKASRYLTKLADIIYNGRELNVCLLVDLQSYNLAAVGLKADRNSRKNFNLVGLGNYSIDELGMVNESYGVLTNLIGDRYIVSDELERANLGTAFKQLQPISKAQGRPIIFSGLSPATLALLPDLRAYKSNQITVSNSSPVAPPISEASLPTDKQAWDRLILESDNDQINELIDQRRSKPQTIDEQIAYAVEAVKEYLEEKDTDSDTARNIYNGKNRLKKVAKTMNDFKDLLELAAEMNKLSYLNEGNSTRVSLIN